MKPTVLTCDNQVKIIHPGGSYETWDVDSRFMQNANDLVLFKHYVDLKGEWNTTGVLVVLIDGQVIFSWETQDEQSACCFVQEARFFTGHFLSLHTFDIKENKILLRFVNGDELELKIQHNSGSPLRMVVRSIPWLYLRDGFIPQQQQDK